MKSARRPDRERERLQALRDADILDTPPEADFDALTRIAAAICGTPIALVSLLDADRQWYKSRVGLAETQTSRDDSLCAHAVLEPDLMEVRDAQADPPGRGQRVEALPEVDVRRKLPAVFVLDGQNG